MKTLTISLAFWLCATSVQAQMNVTLGDPWDGQDVPAGQQCALFKGAGATPPMQVTNAPAGTVQINVEYNDKSYGPLSQNGGHGIIGFTVSGTVIELPSVPGMTTELPAGSFVVAAARSTGEYASPGYLPPCSGGRGNKYSARVKALSAGGEVLEEVVLPIGRY